jgi:hypothetical protein
LYFLDQTFENADCRPAMNHVPTEQLTYATFAGLEKAKFRVPLDETHGIELELVEVLLVRPRGEASTGASEAGQESFSLLFHGPDNRLLPQRMHVFEQEKIGSFELFIVPVGRVAGAIQYQAIFNRQTRRS